MQSWSSRDLGYRASRDSALRLLSIHKGYLQNDFIRLIVDFTANQLHSCVPAVSSVRTGLGVMVLDCIRAGTTYSHCTVHPVRSNLRPVKMSKRDSGKDQRLFRREAERHSGTVSHRTDALSSRLCGKVFGLVRSNMSGSEWFGEAATPGEPESRSVPFTFSCISSAEMSDV